MTASPKHRSRASSALSAARAAVLGSRSPAVSTRAAGRAWIRSRQPLEGALVAALVTLGSVSPTAAQPAATPAPPDPTAAFTRALADARAALARGESEIVESRYRSALREGWLLLGALEFAGGQPQGAIEAFDRAASSASDDRRAILATAMVEIEIDRPVDAARRLRRLAARDPADVEVRQTLARALAAAGSFDEAVQELEEVRALAPEDDRTLYVLATAYLRKGLAEEAGALLDELTTRLPTPETWVLVGRTWRDHGHYGRAREALERAVELNPRQRRAHYYLGTVDLLAEGRVRVDEAIENFERELAVDADDPMSNLYLGIALVDSRRYEAAVAPLELAAGTPTIRRDALQSLGRAYLALDRPGEAIPVLEEALELARAHSMEAPPGVFVDLGESQLSSLNYQLALALRRTGREEEAAAYFEQARDRSARLAESSRQILERFLEEEPSDGSAGSLGPSLEFPEFAALGAEARARLARQIAGAMAAVYRELGVRKIEARRFAGAAGQFRQAAELDPDLEGIQYALGVALFNDGRFAEAVEPLERAAVERDGDLEVQRMLALAHFNSDGYERAIELLGDDPGRGEERSIDYTYGVALARAGRAEEAEAVFDRLLAAYAEWPELNVVLGQAHAQQDDFETAERFLGRALELDPQVAEARATLGDIYLRQGKLDDAEAALRAELAARPEDTRSLYTLAMVLELNRRPEEAERLLRQLLEARPKSPEGRYLLGKILLAEGSPELAVEQLELAAVLDPEDASVRYQLGQALQKLGRVDEARREFDTYRRLKRGEDAEVEEPS